MHVERLWKNTGRPAVSWTTGRLMGKKCRQRVLVTQMAYQLPFTSEKIKEGCKKRAPAKENVHTLDFHHIRRTDVLGRIHFEK